MKEELVETSGTIIAPLAAGNFKVRLENGLEVLARLVKHHIRIVAGDRVELELSPYDWRRARITYRLRE